MAVKARLEIVEGRFDDATQTLQCGYTMARNIAEAPLLIHGLVGMAISNMMTKRVEELITQPNSPNMYWTLSALPSPVISIREAIDSEMHIFDMLFPELRDIENIPGTSEDWWAIANSISEKGTAMFTLLNGEGSKNRNRMMLMALVIKEYPHAKSTLIAEGLAPEKVEAMPVAQVVALHAVGRYGIARDNIHKWFGLPYWQAHKGLENAEKQLREAHKQPGSLSIAGILLPALTRVKFVEVRTERNVALLRAVEAIRLHVATNNSCLPMQSNEVTSVPWPIDPVTGKPFSYRLKDDIAIIDAPAPEGELDKHSHKTIEIQLIKTNSK